MCENLSFTVFVHLFFHLSWKMNCFHWKLIALSFLLKIQWFYCSKRDQNEMCYMCDCGLEYNRDKPSFVIGEILIVLKHSVILLLMTKTLKRDDSLVLYIYQKMPFKRRKKAPCKIPLRHEILQNRPWMQFYFVCLYCFANFNSFTAATARNRSDIKILSVLCILQLEMKIMEKWS